MEYRELEKMIRRAQNKVADRARVLDEAKDAHRRAEVELEALFLWELKWREDGVCPTRTITGGKLPATEILAGAELDAEVADADADAMALIEAEIERQCAGAEAKVIKMLKDPFAEVPTKFKAGIYDAFVDSRHYRLPLFVYPSSSGTHFLAKVYDGGGVFTYLGAAARFTRPDLRRADQSQFGQEHGFCGFCAQELTDGESRSRGYGPVCAKNNGLPYGSGK